MRRALWLLALAAAAPLAGAALPATCADPCTVDAHVAGYVAPAVVIESGTSVVFVDADAPHVTADGPGVALDPFCFSVSEHVPVRFDVAGNALTATVEDETLACGSARANAAGQFVLPIFCRLHPTMRGSIVVG